MSFAEFMAWLDGYSHSFDLVAPVPSPEDPDPLAAPGPSPVQWCTIVTKLRSVRAPVLPTPPVPIPGVGTWPDTVPRAALVNPLQAGTFAALAPALTDNASPADADGEGTAALRDQVRGMTG